MSPDQSFVLRRHGHMHPAVVMAVPCIEYRFDYVLLERSAAFVSVSMEFKKSLGKRGIVQPLVGQDMGKDLYVSPLFHQPIEI